MDLIQTAIPDTLNALLSPSLIITLLLTCVVSLQWLMARGANHRYQQAEQKLNVRIDELEKQLYAVNQGAIGVGRRLIRVEQELKRSGSAPQKVTRAKSFISGLDQAAAMRGKGASVSEIVRKTGIGRAEAELVSLMTG